jgi:4-amino-4-deoxy-L-arabinose transferase-like glycosyltransferase
MNPTSRPWWRHPALWVALFALATTFAFLGLRGIWDPDEGRYTNVALNMIDSGDW